jgi:hypothetical protein
MSHLKPLLILLFLLFVLGNSYAQTIPPPYINYQAVLYDVNSTTPNAVLANQSFQTFVNIQDQLGNLLYKEEHFASTDANGLITVKMGDGIYTAGTITNFNQIDWGTGKYYLVVDFNINGTISSTAPEQLVTVPYSFYAGNAGNGIQSVTDNGNGSMTFTYLNGSTYTTPVLSGLTGPAGKNALIKTTTEPSGANCTNGGTKIETGLDVNSNGTLDNGEINVSQTQYVCNGVSSNINPTFSNDSAFYASHSMRFVSNNEQFIVPAYVYSIQIELASAGGGGGGPGWGCGYGCGGYPAGSGAYVKTLMSVLPGDTLLFSVGNGGAGAGGCGTGGTGGSSSIMRNGQLVISATGGTGGAGGGVYPYSNGLGVGGSLWIHPGLSAIAYGGNAGSLGNGNMNSCGPAGTGWVIQGVQCGAGGGAACCGGSGSSGGSGRIYIVY